MPSRLCIWHALYCSGYNLANCEIRDIEMREIETTKRSLETIEEVAQGQVDMEAAEASGTADALTVAGEEAACTLEEQSLKQERLNDDANNEALKIAPEVITDDVSNETETAVELCVADNKAENASEHAGGPEKGEQSIKDADINEEKEKKFEVPVEGSDARKDETAENVDLIETSCDNETKSPKKAVETEKPKEVKQQPKAKKPVKKIKKKF